MTIVYWGAHWFGVTFVIFNHFVFHSPQFTLSKCLDAALVLGNSHLFMNRNNKLAVIASHIQERYCSSLGYRDIALQTKLFSGVWCSAEAMERTMEQAMWFKATLTLLLDQQNHNDDIRRDCRWRSCNRPLPQERKAGLSIDTPRKWRLPGPICWAWRGTNPKQVARLPEYKAGPGRDPNPNQRF